MTALRIATDRGASDKRNCGVCLKPRDERVAWSRQTNLAGWYGSVCLKPHNVQVSGAAQTRSNDPAAFVRSPVLDLCAFVRSPAPLKPYTVLHRV